MVAPERTPTQDPENQHNNQTPANTEDYRQAENARLDAELARDNFTKDIDPRSHKRRGVLIAVGAVASGIALTTAAYFGVKSAANEQIDRIVGDNERHSSAPATLDTTEVKNLPEINLESATVDEFYSNRLTDEQRVEWAWNKLSEPSTEQGREGLTILQAKHAELQAKYNDPTTDYKYIEDLSSPSENMTGDQILALQTTIFTLAAETTELSDVERQKILAAALDNEEASIKGALRSVEMRSVDSLNGIHRVSESDGVKWESPVFRTYLPENGYDPAGIPSKILSTMNVNGKSGDNDFQQTFQFRNGVPIRVAFHSASDTDHWISYPEKIPAEPSA